MKIIQLLFLAVSFYACNNDNKRMAEVSDSSPRAATTDDRPAANDDELPADIYGIRVNNTNLFLQQWDSTYTLEKDLGKPLINRTKQLDLNSDTYAGSFIRDLEYPGLKLKLFSPKQNGKTFWIQEIILTDKRYQTVNGVRIGDDLEKVKQAYPSIKKFPGVNENMYYVANAGYEKSIEMEFENNKLKKLRLYYMMN